MDSITE